MGLLNNLSLIAYPCFQLYHNNKIIFQLWVSYSLKHSGLLEYGLLRTVFFLSIT
jgi:hypothetical protein